MEALTRIELDLELSAGAIAGLLSNGDGRQWPFHGWMELAAAIEAAASAARSGSATEQTTIGRAT